MFEDTESGSREIKAEDLGEATAAARLRRCDRLSFITYDSLIIMT